MNVTQLKWYTFFHAEYYLHFNRGSAMNIKYLNMRVHFNVSTFNNFSKI